ncbi:amidohydrolase family protein [Nocardia vaccinii]|uniref:amidohydrolase family protein n=1 Tax=Nocardia vaccinii TaxID=1822 RepID=UPI00083405E8|nr:amidohydrolase family protein [Nocardia vaccinii]
MITQQTPTDIVVTPRPVQHIVQQTDTREMLANARKDIARYGLDKYFIVDVDAHHHELRYWDDVLEYIDDPVLRRNALAMNRLRPGALMGHTPGLNYQDVAGRIPHSNSHRLIEGVPEGRSEDVELLVRAIESMGIDLQVIFPQPMLEIGLHPQSHIEVALTKAYTRWLVDHTLKEDPRIKTLVPLPFVDPKACIEMVNEHAANPSVLGFMVTSQRHQGVQHRDYMPLYDLIQDTGKPIAFHAGPSFGEPASKALNKFISVHAVTFVTCNIVHMTNWILNGIPERFPGLKSIWVESGIAWVPFLMQRLDHEFLMRQSDAPLLKRLPSDYMKECYYSTQPMEADNLKALEYTMEIMGAEDNLLYSSDWPHWDFDAPSSIASLPFLSETAKRNILGETARKLFNLPHDL